MSRRKSKKINKFATAVISLIAAVIIWAGVVYVTSPEMSTTIYNIPVRLGGADMLADRGLVVVDKSSISGLSVTISGNRNDLLRISGNIFVDVDVSDIDEAGEYDMDGSVTLPSQKLTIKKINFDSVPIRVDTLSTKEVSVEVRQSGSVEGKLVKTTPETEKITVTGAESELGEVDHARIDADISEITEDTEREMPYILSDRRGAPVTKNETLTPEKPRINVAYAVYDKVTLPIKLRLGTSLSQEYSLDTSKSSVSPSDAEVGIRAGISVPEEVYAEITKNAEESECQLVETEGMYIPENVKTVSVKSVLTKKSPGKAVQVTSRGLDASYEAVIADIFITPEDNVTDAQLQAASITAYVDLTDYEAGEHSVPVIIESADVSLTQQYYTTVKISKKG